MKDKYGVGKAFLFISFIPENQQLYTSLQQAGFILVFTPVLATKTADAKGNVDADLVLKAMTEYNDYEKAVIVTSDGDFYSLVEYLYLKNKLETVLSTSPNKCRSPSAGSSTDQRNTRRPRSLGVSFASRDILRTAHSLPPCAQLPTTLDSFWRP